MVGGTDAGRQGVRGSAAPDRPWRARGLTCRRSQMAPPGLLAGVTVVDLTFALAGSYAPLFLAGLGARGYEGRRSPPTVKPPATTRLHRRRRHQARRNSDKDKSLALLARSCSKLSVTQPQPVPTPEREAGSAHGPKRSGNRRGTGIPRRGERSGAPVLGATPSSECASRRGGAAVNVPARSSPDPNK